MSLPRVPSRSWVVPTIVFAVVLAAQLALVAVAGTDVPFYDQWQIEGGWLYPAWCDGSLRPADLFRPFNEHRLVWSHLLNLGLFVLNGQWDPLAQLVVVAGVRSAGAALVAAAAARATVAPPWVVGLVVIGAFLPFAAWHNALWGIESFVLWLSLAALWLLGTGVPSRARLLAGLLAGIAALVAMGPGALVPLVLLGWAAFRAVESRGPDAPGWRVIGPALILLVLGLALRVPSPANGNLDAASAAQFASALSRLLGWPHGQPLAAVLMNAPLLLLLFQRLRRRRAAAPGENVVLLTAGWSGAIAGATAWMRGGGTELAVGVPSRYADFLVFLPLANLWSVWTLAREAPAARGPGARIVALAWTAALLAGWLALGAQVFRGIVLPRAQDRDAPIRLVQAYQRSRDPAVFSAQPRLLVAHPHPAVIGTVLDDPRLQGRLPPSLQPDRPPGPLSRAARWLLRR